MEPGGWGGGGGGAFVRPRREVSSLFPSRRVLDQLVDSSRLSERALFRRAAQLTIYQWTKISEMAGTLGEAREREGGTRRVDGKG